MGRCLDGGWGCEVLEPERVAFHADRLVRLVAWTVASGWALSFTLSLECAIRAVPPEPCKASTAVAAPWPPSPGEGLCDPSLGLFSVVTALAAAGSVLCLSGDLNGLLRVERAVSAERWGLLLVSVLVTLSRRRRLGLGSIVLGLWRMVGF